MSTISAGKVAAELRKLADALDTNPGIEITKPWVNFYGYDKATFAAVVKLLPRPLAKKVDDGDVSYRRIRVEYKSEAIDVDASVPQHLTCELVEPAKPAVYRCDPLLSLEEIDEVAK
jgi:hypothetical protein